MLPKVSIIILNWNQEQDTRECLASLKEIKYPNYRIILVDNGSSEKIDFPGVSTIRNPKNLGFAEGNNIGIKYALKDNPDYILLLNNDTTVEPDFLMELTNHGRVDIASPKIMFYDDPKKIWFAGGDFWPIIKKPFHKYYRQAHTRLLDQKTKWVSGCCMLINRKVIDKIGLLDKDYFNNYEDVDYCLRASSAGFKISLIQSSKIYHKFAASMGGKFSPFYTYFRTRNNLLFFKKSKQWLPLMLNLIIFPIYSVFVSIKNRQIGSIKTTGLAIWDFLRGRYGAGSMETCD